MLHQTAIVFQCRAIKQIPDTACSDAGHMEDVWLQRLILKRKLDPLSAKKTFTRELLLLHQEPSS